MAGGEEEKDWPAEMEKSERVKTTLALLVIREGGDVELNPPYNASGMEIQRLVAREKFGGDLAQFTAILGGNGSPSMRFAMLTTEACRRFDEDLSFKFKWWDCYPALYSGLLNHLRAQLNRQANPEPEKKRRK